ncbi:GNAT family N-acetyltransferase [Mariniluteicoccus flavus]
MTPRLAVLADLPAIVALEADGFPPGERWSEASWRSELEADNRDVLVAGEPVAGVITVQHVGGVADLNRVVVASAERGRGLGRQLVEAGVAAAWEAECEEMLLEVRHDNVAALHLYAQQGFVEIARRRGYYGPGVDAVILRRELTDDPNLPHDPTCAHHCTSCVDTPGHEPHACTHNDSTDSEGDDRE